MKEKRRGMPGGGSMPHGGERTSSPTPDLAELSKQMTDVAEKSRHLVAEFLKRQSAEDGVGMANPLSIGAAFFEMTARMMSDPSRLVQAQLSLWNDYMTLWQRTAQRFLGGSAEPMIEPTAGRPALPRHGVDRQHAVRLHQAELPADGALAARHGASDVEGIDERTARKVDFYTRQFVDAIAPSNFLMTNPEVLAGDDRKPRREPAQRAEEPARRSRTRQGSAGDQDDRYGGVPHRREHRGDAGQGRLPERSPAADPIRADDRDSQAPAAADHPALDQQILHPRFAAQQLVHPLGGRRRATPSL